MEQLPQPCNGATKPARGIWPFFTRGIVTGYEITDIKPGHSVTTESRRGGTFPIRVTRTVVPLGESRCRITVDLVGRPQGFRHIIKPLLVKVVRDSIESDYRRLKRLLEKVDEED